MFLCFIKLYYKLTYINVTLLFIEVNKNGF